MKKKHMDNFTKLTASFDEEDPEIVEIWTADIKAWEKDKSKRNPYKEPEMSRSQSFNDITLGLIRCARWQVPHSRMFGWN